MQYDVLIYPVYSRSSKGIFFLRRIRAKEKIAFDGSGDGLETTEESLRWSKYCTKVVSGGREKQLELERNEEFISKISSMSSVVVGLPRLWFYDRDEMDLEYVKAKYRLDDDGYIIIFPGYPSSMRAWPKEQWGMLSEYLLKEYLEKKIVALGSAHERDDIDEIIKGAGHGASRVLNLCGYFSLRLVAKIIGNAAFLVSIDTCAVHMAAAMGTPNVCIMGGGHFGRFYPYGDLEKNRIVFKKMDCFGCNWKCKYDTVRCINEIKADDVFEEIQRLPINKTEEICNSRS